MLNELQAIIIRISRMQKFNKNEMQIRDNFVPIFIDGECSGGGILNVKNTNECYTTVVKEITLLSWNVT